MRKERNSEENFWIFLPTSAWRCSVWGLHCHYNYLQCGKLLPYHFTLTTKKYSWRYLFCCTFRHLSFTNLSPIL